MLAAAGELEQHPEAARVELVDPGLRREPLQRAVGDERHRRDQADAEPVGGREQQRRAGVVRQRLLPRPVHDAAGDLERAGGRVDGLAVSPRVALDRRPVGERDPQHLVVRVPVGGDEREPR
ncbi:MAG: hypothetical protein ACXVZL_13220, partial [Gaiellaceae bacterium]